MTLVKFNTKRDRSLLPGFEDVFDSFFKDSFINDKMISRVPAVNISESDGKYHIELAAPGLQKEDFKLSLDQNLLTIAVEKSVEKNDDGKNYNKKEFSYTSFVRSFTLPDTADDSQIEASYENGLLQIDIAKKPEAQAIVRKIEIK